MKRVVVLGAGTMGNGIAQVTAMFKYQVSMLDISDDLLKKGMNSIQSSLSRMEKKGKLSAEEVKETIRRITPTLDFNVVKESEIVIEAVPEQFDLKKKIFKRLDELCPKETILGTNTSSLPITEIAMATKRPEMVLGIHFMNPVPVMRGVEVIKGYHTSEETLNRAVDFLKSIDKVPGIAPDYPGFVNSRILNVYLNEAVNCVLMGATPEDVDNIMVHCCNMPIGPLRLLDMVGLDVHLSILNFLTNELGDKYKPSPLTQQMVRAGRLGMKSGKGFYDYQKS